MTALDWRRMPPLTTLRAFEATARLGGFSAAARALNVTPAAVAQQVRALEERLSRPLVWRDGKALRLTEEGERLAAALAEGFAAMQAALDHAALPDADRPLTVTMAPSFAAQWLMPRLGRFWKRHPDIALSLHPDHRLFDLGRERMELGIRFGKGHWPGVVSDFLTSARYIVVGAPELLGDRMAGRSRLPPEELAALPWVKESDWPEQAQWLQDIGIDPAGIEFTEFPNEELALAAARQGFGLHIESAALVEADLEAGTLVCVFDTADETLGYYIVTPPGPLRAEARAFIDWLKEEI